MWQATAIMFIAMSFVPAGDMAGKLLTSSGAASPVFVAWSRFLIGALLVLPFVPPAAYRLILNWRVWLRGLLLGCGILCIQTALQTEPLADVFAAFFVGPIVSYILSVMLLGERATAMRSVLMAVGFAGVLLVVRPGLGGSGGLIWALLAGTFYGAYLTASRWLADLGAATHVTFAQLVISAAVFAPLGLAHLPEPTWHTAGWTTASAAFSMIGNLLLLVAYQKAEATRIAPLVYFQLIAATALGWVAFGDVPDLWTWAGLVLVISAGLTSAALRR